MLYEVITGKGRVDLLPVVRPQVFAGERQGVHLLAAHVGVLVFPVAPDGVGEANPVGAIRALAGRQRAFRITSYNVCYTKLLRT